MPFDDSAMREAVRAKLVAFNGGHSKSFCIRTMVDELHEDHGHLRGTVLAAILTELEDNSLLNDHPEAAE